MGEHRHSRIMENPDVKRWYGNVAEGSGITADTALRRLGLFCEFTHMEPMDLLKLNEKEVNDLLVDFVRDFRGAPPGHSGPYIATMVKAVKSWLQFNGITVTRKIKIGGLGTRVTLKEERVPTQEELKRIFLAGDTKERAASAIMAFTGVRPQVLGNYRGTDGLRISDIKDIKINQETMTVEIMKIPSRIVIRSELSKKDNEYFTFMGPEGMEYLKAYLEERMKQGEVLIPGSPVLTPAKAGIRLSNPFVSTTNIGDTIRHTIRNAGLKLRPYVLRKYFDTQLLQAESRVHELRRDYRVFWMGHTGDMEHEYTLNHGILPDSTIEDMRAAYAKALKFLETEEHGIKEEDYQKMLRTSAIEAFTGAFGITLTEDQKEELLSIGTEEYQKRLGELFKDKRADLLNNGNKHKTIPETELESYLNRGWELVQIYPRGDKAVVRLPS